VTTQYKVTYEIDVEADSPREACLEAEKILNNMHYRPYLTVKNMDTGEVNSFDLEETSIKQED
jgi:hypothetical protein